MSKATTLTAMIITPVFLLLTSSCTSTRKIEHSVKYLEANEAFSTVYNATRQAILKANLGGFELESIDIKLGTTSNRNGQVGAKIWVVSGKYSKAYSKAKSATFTFSDLTKGDKSIEELAPSKEFIDHLYKVLIAAKEIKPIETFGLSEFVAEVEFTITKTVDVEGEIELSPVTPSLGFSRESEYAHSVSIKFKRTKKSS
jgi:hypothetical protein